jgi:hypothetical protein
MNVRHCREDKFSNFISSFAWRSPAGEQTAEKNPFYKKIRWHDAILKDPRIKFFVIHDIDKGNNLSKKTWKISSALNICTIKRNILISPCGWLIHLYLLLLEFVIIPISMKLLNIDRAQTLYLKHFINFKINFVIQKYCDLHYEIIREYSRTFDKYWSFSERHKPAILLCYLELYFENLVSYRKSIRYFESDVWMNFRKISDKYLQKFLLICEMLSFLCIWFDYSVC